MAPGVPYDYLCGEDLSPHSVIYDQSMEAAPAAPPAQPQQPSGQAIFLHQWQHHIQPRLTQLLAQLGGQEVAKSLALAQVRIEFPPSSNRFVFAHLKSQKILSFQYYTYCRSSHTYPC